MTDAMRNQSKPTQGFTLVELLIVIAIVAVLAAVTMSVSRRMMASANETVCAANLRGLATALNSYAAENNGVFPVSDQGNRSPSNWIVALLDGEYLNAKQADTQRSFVNSRGKNGLFCPAAIRVAKPLDGNWNTYAMNVQAGGWYQSAGQAPAARLTRVQYPAETALVMDGCRVSGTYYVTTVGRADWFPEMVHPPELLNQPKELNRGANVAFVDGHTEFRKVSKIPTDTTGVFWSGIKP
jgi:prepilin-type N-terminal cleavage/methylation domain-containing protein/prepilin-type processing-associated H-X9-DG protein